MSRFHSYLRSAVSILDLYTGSEPLASFLKKYFAQHKKHGSSDRKQISHLCYTSFRSGKSLAHLPAAQRIIQSLFLCSASPNDLLAALDPSLNEQLPIPLPEKLQRIGITDENIFPWHNELSTDIAFLPFVHSFFTQPDMFLRIRPGMQDIVLQKLQAAGVVHSIISPSCIALPNTTKADIILQLNKEAVIQDLSSQRVAQLLAALPAQHKPWKVWDCCAASGGKSILAADMLGDIQLTVSDVRPAIVANLQKRFAEAGILNYKHFTADLTEAGQLPAADFNLVIADLPCSGSGTWGRTPEQLFYYAFDKTNYYASLQQQLLRNVVTKISEGGYLLYITCSVFAKENEEMITWLQQQYKLQLLQSTILAGYSEKADTMFAALLQKPL